MSAEGGEQGHRDDGFNACFLADGSATACHPGEECLVSRQTGPRPGHQFQDNFIAFLRENYTTLVSFGPLAAAE